MLSFCSTDENTQYCYFHSLFSSKCVKQQYKSLFSQRQSIVNHRFLVFSEENDNSEEKKKTCRFEHGKVWETSVVYKTELDTSRGRGTYSTKNYVRKTKRKPIKNYTKYVKIKIVLYQWEYTRSKKTLKKSIFRWNINGGTQRWKT